MTQYMVLSHFSQSKRSVGAAVCVLAVLVANLMCSCNPEAKAVSGKDVKIEILPVAVSSGFMNFSFKPNKDAYYHVGIVPVSNAPDTLSNASVRAFMNLKLDEAYTNYITWRHALLEKNTPYIAEFPTHSLQYGNVEYNFTFLDPETDYMIYAFVVDAKTNKPDGRLFTYFVTTSKESMYERMQFEYRVRGYWDYVYPVYASRGSETYEIIDYVPWVGTTVDSLDLVEYAVPTVQDYFLVVFDLFAQGKLEDYVHFGIFARNNNGWDENTSDMYFEEGHTYYTGLAMMDGYLSKNTLTVYKFKWMGEDTQFYFAQPQQLQKDW